MTGQFQIYTGDGKGKTTAALGLALRAAGAGFRIYIGQFIKTAATAEAEALRTRFADCVTHAVYGPAHFIRGAPTPADRAAARAGLDALRQALAGGAYALVIGDEAVTAAAAGLFEESDLLALADARPPAVELVLTGRGAGDRLKARADLVTEMRAVKHYFESGMPARRGIEW